MGRDNMGANAAPASEHITIGIDISKDNLDVHLHSRGTIQRFIDARKGRTKRIARAKARQPTA